nr:anti-phage-associated DUF499 domain-containing protein [Tepidiforma thermophila]
MLQEKALDIHVSDQVEQLDQLINNEGTGDAFFERTFVTEGMRILLSEGIARLAGKSNDSVFHLKQAMGGGKTHLLVAFGLLARDRDLRNRVIPDVRYINVFESARVAAFNGRNSPKEYFWGLIARQLGKAELFKRFWESGPEAPGEEDWLQLFSDDLPVLILLDEMPPYFNEYITKPIGQGTVADIVTRAFANLLTAASKKRNVCIVVSDLAAAYSAGSSLINRALEDARREIGRLERAIVPVDLSSNEVYEILRKRLFRSLPDDAEIRQVAQRFRDILQEGVDARLLQPGADAIADEVPDTYPFHPRFKNIVALFKENEDFRQTRGLLELSSRLLRSVWNRPSDDVYLIGPQHFDLSDRDVRESLQNISGMSDVISRDIWDQAGSAHAQQIDATAGSDDAAQVASLLLVASLSTAVEAVKGLTEGELLECLATPGRDLGRFKEAFRKLAEQAWYLHHTTEGRYYFDRQENLTRMLQNIARDAPQPQVDALLRGRIKELFEPKRKAAYGALLVFPTMDELAAEVGKDRVLAVMNPADSTIDRIRAFFNDLDRKNNLLVLTGQSSDLVRLDEAARNLYAARKGAERPGLNNAQREELEEKRAAYEQGLTTTILNLLDRLLVPRQRKDQPASLDELHVKWQSDQSKPFSGESDIERILTVPPAKLYFDVEKGFDTVRELAEDVLWPQGMVEARWQDIVVRYESEPRMVWLPKRGLDDLKQIACNRGLWEDLRNGYISKQPRKKKTSVAVVPSEPDDAGKVRLRVTATDAGPAPRVHYAEDATVSTASNVLPGDELETTALRVEFLAVDPSGEHETGEPYVWKHPLKIQNLLDEAGLKRRVTLIVLPRSDEIRYTLDASDPRNGVLYEGPVEIPDTEVSMRVFARAGNNERSVDFRFPQRGSAGTSVEPEQPARVRAKKGNVSLSSRKDVYDALQLASQRGFTFSDVVLTVSAASPHGQQIARATLNGIDCNAAYLEGILGALQSEAFGPDASVVMQFQGAAFARGQDLLEFAELAGINLSSVDVQQP